MENPNGRIVYFVILEFIKAFGVFNIVFRAF